MESIGVPLETAAGERRVALTPAVIASYTKADLTVRVQRGAGASSGFPDEAYADKGAELVADRAALAGSDVIVQVQITPQDPPARSGQIVVGLANALAGGPALEGVATSGAVLFDMALMPRITRAQSMDALSSQASIAGYKGVLLMAEHLPKMFPMLTTAAGTIAPARVLVVGVGVAGLQAIATARRLGAVVQAYDVRAAAAEQVESLGARFVELDIDASEAEGEGGYAKEQSEDFLQRQREALGRVVAAHDCVITTALVPGKKAPVIITRAMVEQMAPGSVVVDLAAEQGGNCEATVAGEIVDVSGVQVVGATDVAASVGKDASQMYAKNVANFVQHLAAQEVFPDLEDEITRDTLVTHDGQVVHPRVREALGLEALAEPATQGGDA